MAGNWLIAVCADAAHELRLCGGRQQRQQGKRQAHCGKYREKPPRKRATRRAIRPRRRQPIPYL
jgi:hypothetical protein